MDMDELTLDIPALTEVTGGDTSINKELFDLYYSKFDEQIAQIEAAIKARDAILLKAVAHSAKGGSASMGLNKMAAIMKVLEFKGRNADFTNAEDVVQAAYTEQAAIKMLVATERLVG